MDSNETIRIANAGLDNAEVLQDLRPAVHPLPVRRAQSNPQLRIPPRDG